MKNKGRRHKSGIGPHANGNCKGALAGITRDIRSMGKYSSENSDKDDSQKWMKKKVAQTSKGLF